VFLLKEQLIISLRCWPELRKWTGDRCCRWWSMGRTRGLGTLRGVFEVVWEGVVCVSNAVVVMECEGPQGNGEEKGSEESGGRKKTVDIMFTRNKITFV